MAKEPIRCPNCGYQDADNDGPHCPRCNAELPSPKKPESDKKSAADSKS